MRNGDSPSAVILQQQKQPPALFRLDAGSGVTANASLG